MSLLRHFRRLQFIDFLIRKNATGSLESFARRNRLSKRGLTDVLQEMKELGFPIKYDRSRNSYCYEETGELVKCLFIKSGQLVSKEETRNISSEDARNLCFSKVMVFEVCKNE